MAANIGTHSVVGAPLAGDLAAVPNQPLVSIGMPVFNGTQFLGEALESLLNQTNSNIELIISDNASTDTTPEICAHYASLDRRIRYSRLSENIGGLPNHNRVFSLATGKYFMWASHDDLFLPSYIDKCVECLEKDTSAVLAYTKTSIIDDAGRVQRLMVESHLAGSPCAAERFSEFTDLYSILEAFYGLIRREVLEKTMLHLPHPGSDRLLLAELSLRGRFVQIPEYLFKRRRHAGDSIRTCPNIRERYSSLVPAFKHKRMFPHWGYIAGYTRVIFRTPLAFRDRASCAIVILRLIRYSWRELLDDLRS
jgi:glycosyltransferase involved in cell wall biosynthesis